MLYVLKLAKQLLLISQLIEQFFKVKFEGTKCWLKSFDLNKMIAKVFKKEYYINRLELLNPWLQNVAPRLKGVTWYQTFGQFSMHVLTTKDKNNLVEGMDLNGDHDLNFCIDVCMVKHHHTPYDCKSE